MKTDKLLKYFKDAVSNNAPIGWIYFSDSHIFYGRIFKGTSGNLLIIGYNKNKQLKIYSYKPEAIE